MKYSLYAVVLFIGMPLMAVAGCDAQPTLKAKNTVSSQKLNEAAMDYVAKQATIQKNLETARADEQKQFGDIQQKIQAASKALSDALKTDPKYKDQAAAIDDMQKQMTALDQRLQAQFNQANADTKKALDADAAKMTALTDVVKTESKMPANAAYNVATQTWTVPPPTK